MTTTTDHPAVRAYLDDLRGLLAGSPDRDLVVDGVVRHIEDALGGGPVDAAHVQAVLDELGDPAVIAAEAAPAPAPAPGAPAPFLERRSGAVLTVLVLAFGGIVVPVLGWIVGLGLLWFSKGWTVVDKLVGTLAPFVLGGLALLVAALVPTAATAGCTTACSPVVVPTHLLLLLGLVVGAVFAALHLLRRFRPAGQ